MDHRQAVHQDNQIRVSQNKTVLRSASFETFQNLDGSLAGKTTQTSAGAILGGYTVSQDGAMKVNPQSPHPSQMVMGNGVLETERSIIIGGTSYPAPTKGSMMHSTMQNFTGQYMQNMVRQGSNYSSPRSSLGSGGGDSKNSSPRTSLINPPPPPPYDQRFGSPRSSLASPRSSLSTTSLESKHSSPRTSLAGMSGMLFDRHPSSPRASLAYQDNFHNSHLGHPSPSSIVQRNMAFLNENRFNEAAPPPPYTEPRLRTLPSQGQASVPVTYLNNVNSNNNSLYYQQMTASNNNLKNHQVNQLVTKSSPTHTIPPALPARVPINPQQHLAGIPGQPSNVDLERTLAVLTKELEDSMRLSTGSSRKNSLDSIHSNSSQTIPKQPPPPYHGPHKTEPVPVLPPRKPRYSSPSVSTNPQSQQYVPGPASSVSGSLPSSPAHMVRTPPSAAVRPQAQLPYQVSPSTRGSSTEAEKKIAALTQQLEDEMEKTPQGEYFGKYLIKV